MLLLLNILGAKKFKVERFSLAVMDQTGGEVEEDEVLLRLAENTMLVLLTEDDEWTEPASGETAPASGQRAAPNVSYGVMHVFNLEVD